MRILVFFFTLIVTLNVSAQKTFEKYYRQNSDSISEIGAQLTALSSGQLRLIGSKNDSTLLIRNIDKDGKLLHEKSINGNWMYFLTQTSDNGYLVGEDSILYYSNYFSVIKIDSSGKIIWKISCDTLGYLSKSIIATRDSGFLLSTSNYGNAENGACLVKLDKYGKKVWSVTIWNNSNTVSPSINSLYETTDGSFLCKSDAYAGIGHHDEIFFKFDKLGNQQWKKVNYFSYLNAISYSETNDTLNLLEFYWDYYADSSYIFLEKMTLKGEHISSHQIIVPGVGLQLYNPGFMPFKNHWLALLNVDSPEYTNHVFSRLLLIDSSANILWKRDYGKGDTCILENLISTKDGGFAMLGYRNDSNSLQDFYLVRTYDSTLYTSLEQKNKNHESLKIYPNPTSGSFTIHIPESLNNFETAIFNSSGQNVYSKHFSSASEFSLNLEDNPKGIYFVRITSENKLYSSIIVKE